MAHCYMILAFWLVVSVAATGCFTSSNGADDASAEAENDSAKGSAQDGRRDPPREQAFHAVRPIRISQETTRIVEPLDDDGYPDYIEALDRRSRRGVAADNNYAVVLLRTFGPGYEIKPEIRDAYYERLGIVPLPNEENYLVEPHTYIQQNHPDKEDAYYEVDFQTQPWRADELPELAQWVREYSDHLDRLRPTSTTTRCYFPIVAPPGKRSLLLTTSAGGTNQMRNAAQSLTARAMLRLGEGDIEAAWEDLIACRRIALLAAEGPLLLDQLICDAVNGIVHPSIITVAQDSRLTRVQAQRFQRDIRGIPRRPNSLVSLGHGERYVFLDGMCAILREGPVGLHGFAWISGGGFSKVLESMSAAAFTSEEEDATAESAVEAATAEWLAGMTPNDRQLANLQRIFRAIDWNVVLETGNEYFDGLVEISNIRNDQKRLEHFATFQEQWWDRGDAAILTEFAETIPAGTDVEFSQRLAASLVEFYASSIRAAVESEQHETTRRHLSETAFALAAYHHDHGEYPQRLAALRTSYVDELPIDGFDWRPLRYQKKDDGYLLYSVGRNQRDDGGGDRYTDGDLDDDDIAIRLPPYRETD